MNVLPRDKQVAIISALAEGCSLRAVERMVGVHRDTAMRLAVRVGNHCQQILDEQVRGVNPGVIECDEVWTYCVKKDQRFPLEQQGPEGEGSHFVAMAMDRDSKLVLTHRVGKRDVQLADDLMWDLQGRIIGRPTIVTDGWVAYFHAVAKVFGTHGVDFGQLVKSVTEKKRRNVREGYAPPQVVRVRKYPVFGDVSFRDISTSLVERQNWTLRTGVRRMTRLSNGFSRKLENLRAAVALHYAAYNFCKPHRTIKTTPAMRAGVALRPWAIADLLP